MMFLDTFRQNSGGGFVPYVRDENRRLQQVTAAALPGPSFWYMRAPEKTLGLVGNRGGGKTYTMILKILSGIGRGWGSAYNCVLLRSSLREMTDLVTMINDIVTPIWGKSVAFNKLAHVWEWKTGERLELNYYINEKSFDLYQGKSFAVIAWEELSLQENLTGFFKMYSSLRSALPEDVMPRQVLFTANPGGASHNAIAHHFQLTGIPPAVGPCIVDVNGEKRRCFNIGFQDNALLRRTTPNYMNDIEIACLGDEPRLQSWKYGNWSIVAGGALDDIFFKHGKNIFVEPFEIPAEGQLFASYDHGSTHPYAYLIWWVSNGCTIRLKSGRMMPTKVGDFFMVGEVYGWNGTPNQGTHESIADITAKIRRYQIKRGFRYREPTTGKWISVLKRNFADDQIGQDMNEFSIQDKFKEPVMVDGEKVPGINFELVVKEPGSRVTGFQLLRERLIATSPRTESGIREGAGVFIVRDECPQAARTLPVLPRSKKNLDDVDDASEAHIYDACRYALQADRKPHFSTHRRYMA
ncbi:MAG: hypothetical protein WCF22_13140 [Candidatus Sulfotelmatobacter sp.]